MIYDKLNTRIENNHSCSTAGRIYLLNDMCTNGFDDSTLECFKSYGRMTDVSHISTGIWHIFIGLVGIFGNLTTLIAIPYAAKKKRHGIEKDYSTTTSFLLHLSFVDLMHCVLMAIPRGLMYLNKSSLFGIHGCRIIMYSGMSIFVSDMLALALVALSRCLDTVLRVKWTDFCSKRRNVLMLFTICWIIGLMVIPVMLLIHSHGIEMAWNCETGGCGFIRNCRKLEDSIHLSTSMPKKLNEYVDNTGKCSVKMEIWRKVYIFIFVVPVTALMVIICSYSIIFIKVCQSKRNFSDEKRTFNILKKRQMKMIRTTLILILLNVIFWIMAFTIIALRYDKKLSDSWKPMNTKEYIAYSIFVNVFEMQYALNFFVYIYRSPQYRSAFYDIYKIVTKVFFK